MEEQWPLRQATAPLLTVEVARLQLPEALAALVNGLVTMMPTTRAPVQHPRITDTEVGRP